MEDWEKVDAIGASSLYKHMHSRKLTPLGVSAESWYCLAGKWPAPWARTIVDIYERAVREGTPLPGVRNPAIYPARGSCSASSEGSEPRSSVMGLDHGATVHLQLVPGSPGVKPWDLSHAHRTHGRGP